jgi:nicotine blue oxidoreductase
VSGHAGTADPTVGAGGVAGVVLAAGAGSRFGGAKPLAGFRGSTLLALAVAALRDGGCDLVLVVTGAHGDLVAAEALRAGAVVVGNTGWAEGMGSSLRAGLRAVPPQRSAAVVVLADQPLLGPEPVRRVVAAHRRGAAVARASYRGVPGHPVLFGRAVVAEVAAAARGDAGARDWLVAHADSVVDVPCDGVGDPADVDTAEALRRLDVPRSWPS